MSQNHLLELIYLIRENDIKVHVLKYASRSEVENGLEGDDLRKIGCFLEGHQIETYSTLPFFDPTMIANLYRDGIHPTALGQKALAEAMIAIAFHDLCADTSTLQKSTNGNL